ncbi:MAG: pyridoxamine 5'-phosphate oxidase family protein, partial [Microbacterium gubbeenense]
KARHLAHRPAVSAAYIDGERLGFFTHGAVEPLDAADAQYEEITRHWTAHYGSSPLSWGEDIRMYRIRPRWCVAYAGE